MSLKELSAQYRESGERCRSYVSRLEDELEDEELTMKQIMSLRRRITVASAMARDAIATSNYLACYYDRRVHHEG